MNDHWILKKYSVLLIYITGCILKACTCGNWGVDQRLAKNENNLGRYVAENLSFLGCFAKSTGKRLMMFQGSAVPLFSGWSRQSRYVALCLMSSSTSIMLWKKKNKSKTGNYKDMMIVSGLYI